MAQLKICREISTDLPRQWMAKTAVKYLHKHITTGKCESVLNQLIVPKRKASSVFVKQPQLGNYHTSLDKIVKIHNLLPASAKAKQMGPFKRYLANKTRGLKFPPRLLNI